MQIYKQKLRGGEQLGAHRAKTRMRRFEFWYGCIPRYVEHDPGLPVDLGDCFDPSEALAATEVGVSIRRDARCVNTDRENKYEVEEFGCAISRPTAGKILATIVRDLQRKDAKVRNKAREMRQNPMIVIMRYGYVGVV
jgi:hypothetical protein